MLGGLFNTLAAPVLFDSVIEYPLVVLVACVLFGRGRRPGAVKSGPGRISSYLWRSPSSRR